MWIVYDVIRAKRKTICVSVKDGSVVVRAPLYMTEERVARFVEEHGAWIARRLAEQKASEDRFADVRGGRSILVAGREKPLVLGSRKNHEDENAVYLREMKSAQRLFLAERCDLLVEKTALFSKKTGLVPSDVSLRNYKSRWGSCDAEKRIQLNWRLAMLPDDLQDYVIVHELCHLRHLDHSAAFWQEVAKIFPDYKTRRKRLKEYSFLTLLYR